MTKIAELVDIKTGYANYVNLVQEFNDPDYNRGRMTQYMPIEAHRRAFERLAHLLLPMDNRVYLLLGSYGTGKSHLCLMLANYLSKKTTEPEMAAFFQNWAQKDGVQAEKLRTWRGDGRYLVALAEYGVGDDFESMVLRAVQRACQREEFTGFLDTHYNEAVRQLERWQEREQAGGPAGAFRDFLDQLEQRYPDVTLEALKDDLAAYQPEALKVFEELYRAAVDADFAPRADNLIDILRDFLGNPAFKERYRGLVVIADEFGYILDRGQVSMDVLQRFAEMCKGGVEGSRLAFVGTGHKVSLKAYAGGGLSEADLGVVSDRVEDVELRSEGIEDIIAAVVIPKKDHPAWQQMVAKHTGMFNRFALDCKKAGIFAHLKGPVLRERIVENIYPMHPMATHCVIELSKEIGSAARSVFTFFAGKPSVVEDGSYPWYVERTDVVTDGDLNLYTADLLTRYFKTELHPDNPEAREMIRQHIRNYEVSLKQVEEAAAATLVREIDPLVKRILDVMLVYEIAGIATTFDNLKFGLHDHTEAQESQLRNRLQALVEEQTLYVNPTTNVYEFRQAGTGRDIEHMIDLYVSDPENQPADLAAAIVETEKLSKSDLWLEAKGYNGEYGEDKRLLRVLAQPATLELPRPSSTGDLSYFEYLENELQAETRWRERYEGVTVYVLCETEADIQRARRAAGKNKSERIIVGIPNEPLPIREILLKLQAALHIKQTEPLDEWSLQERARLDHDFIGDETSGYKGEFLQARKRYLDGKALTWYMANATVLVAQPDNVYEPADLLMRRLYEKRNTKAHFDLNQIHVSRFGPGHNAPLIDAVNTLVRTSQPVEVDTGLAANTGPVRYLQKALAEADVLTQTHKATGGLVPYRVETDTGKYARTYPALAALMQRITGLAPGQNIGVRELIADLVAPPFGQGPYALSLFLGVIIRAFGDGLRIKHDPGAWGAVTVQAAGQVFELVDGQHPNAVLEYREITDAEQELINSIFNLFSEEAGAAGQNHTIAEAYGALQQWWNTQPQLAQAPDIYPADDFPTAQELVELLRRIQDYTPHTFILDELQTVYGLDRDDAITEDNVQELVGGLQRDKVAIEEGPERIKDALLRRLMEPFEPESDMYQDYQRAIEAWYKSLDENQKDRFAYDSQRPPELLEHLPKITDPRSTFFESIPGSFGFGLGRVDDWRSDRSDDYVRMFKEALQAIAGNKIRVPEPHWKTTGIGVSRQDTQDGGTQIRYRNWVKLTVSPPEADVRVFLTSTGEDPRQPGVQRQQVQDTWEETIRRSPTIRLVSQNADGAYGRVIRLSFINEDRRYEVQPVSQQRLIQEGAEFKFIFPEDEEALAVTIQSLIEQAIERGLVSKQKVSEVLKRLLSEFQ